MQTKALFLSAVLALASASTASQHEHELRSPQNDNFGRVPPNTRSPNSVVYGPVPSQKLLGIPQLATQFVKREAICYSIPLGICEEDWEDYIACGTSDACLQEFLLNCQVEVVNCPLDVAARQAGGGFPFDDELQGTSSQDSDSPSVNDLHARSPHASSPSYSITAEPASKLELKDDDKHRVVARAGSKISEVIQSAMPANVKNALINDPKAPESLAKEFSGTKVPQWYAKLPASVTNYYATITSPPTMTGIVSKGPEQDKVNDWLAKVQSYKSKLAPELSAMSVAAVSESKEAKRLSELASKNSKAASRNHNDNLKTTVWSEAKKAATLSHDASSKSAYAASASKAVFPPHKGEKKDNGASSTDKRLALGLSIVGAVVCLGFAVAL